MQLQSARRIGRRVQRLRQGKQCAVYYWGRGCVRESDAQRIIGECNCRLLDALAGDFNRKVKRN